MKVRDMNEVQLDYLVAKCEGFDLFETEGYVYDDELPGGREPFKPSTNWKQGGALIEKYGISISDHSPASRFRINGWIAWRGKHKNDTSGINRPTPLVAAMQCIVTTELGIDVDIPEVLK